MLIQPTAARIEDPEAAEEAAQLESQPEPRAEGERVAPRPAVPVTTVRLTQARPKVTRSGSGLLRGELQRLRRQAQSEACPPTSDAAAAASPLQLELTAFNAALQLGVTMPVCSNGVVEHAAGGGTAGATYGPSDPHSTKRPARPGACPPPFSSQFSSPNLDAAAASRRVAMPACSNVVAEHATGGGTERGAACGGAAGGAAATSWQIELAAHWWRRTARGRALRAWRRRTWVAAAWLRLTAGPRGALRRRALRKWRRWLWSAAAVRAATPAAAAACRLGRALEAWRRAAGVVVRSDLLVRLLQRARCACAWRRWARRTRRTRRGGGGARAGARTSAGAGGSGTAAQAQARAMLGAAVAHDATVRSRRSLRTWRLAVAVAAMLVWASTFAASRWARRLLHRWRAEAACKAKLARVEALRAWRVCADGRRRRLARAWAGILGAVARCALGRALGHHAVRGAARTAAARWRRAALVRRVAVLARRGAPSAIAARALARWRHVARGATIVHFVVTASYTAARRARLALAGWRLWAARRRGGVAVVRSAAEVAVRTAAMGALRCWWRRTAAGGSGEAALRLAVAAAHAAAVARALLVWRRRVMPRGGDAARVVAAAATVAAVRRLLCQWRLSALEAAMMNEARRQRGSLALSRWLHTWRAIALAAAACTAAAAVLTRMRLTFAVWRWARRAVQRRRFARTAARATVAIVRRALRQWRRVALVRRVAALARRGAPSAIAARALARWACGATAAALQAEVFARVRRLASARDVEVVWAVWRCVARARRAARLLRSRHEAAQRGALACWQRRCGEMRWRLLRCLQVVVALMRRAAWRAWRRRATTAREFAATRSRVANALPLTRSLVRCAAWRTWRRRATAARELAATRSRAAHALPLARWRRRALRAAGALEQLLEARLLLLRRSLPLHTAWRALARRAALRRYAHALRALGTTRADAAARAVALRIWWHAARGREARRFAAAWVACHTTMRHRCRALMTWREWVALFAPLAPRPLPGHRRLPLFIADRLRAAVAALQRTAQARARLAVAAARWRHGGVRHALGRWRALRQWPTALAPLGCTPTTNPCSFNGALVADLGARDWLRRRSRLAAAALLLRRALRLFRLAALRAAMPDVAWRRWAERSKQVGLRQWRRRGRWQPLRRRADWRLRAATLAATLFGWCEACALRQLQQSCRDAGRRLALRRAMRELRRPVARSIACSFLALLHETEQHAEQQKEEAMIATTRRNRHRPHPTPPTGPWSTCTPTCTPTTAYSTTYACV